MHSPSLPHVPSLPFQQPQEHYAKYEPTIIELKKKYETAMKEKMLVTLDRDKVGATQQYLAIRLVHILQGALCPNGCHHFMLAPSGPGPAGVC